MRPLIFALSLFAALTPDLKQRLLQFLVTDCYTASATQREQLLAGIPEQALWDEYRKGPGDDQIAKARRALTQAYKQRQEFLRRAQTTALPKEEVARAAQVRETQYVQQKLQEFRERYQANALTGIGVVGTATSVPELTTIARDEKNPAAGAAKAALQAIAARTQQQR